MQCCRLCCATVACAWVRAACYVCGPLTPVRWRRASLLLVWYAVPRDVGGGAARLHLFHVGVAGAVRRRVTCPEPRCRTQTWQTCGCGRCAGYRRRQARARTAAARASWCPATLWRDRSGRGPWPIPLPRSRVDPSSPCQSSTVVTRLVLVVLVVAAWMSWCCYPSRTRSPTSTGVCTWTLATLCRTTRSAWVHHCYGGARARR